jgi:membrane protease YdiL (CAAX protease family)
MVLPAFLAWFYFVKLARKPGMEEAGQGVNTLATAAYFGGKLLQFAWPVLWMGGVERRWPQVTGPSPSGLALGFGFGLAVGLGTFALYFFLRRFTQVLAEARPRILAKVREFGLNTPAIYVAFAGFLAVAHSLFEEYYWRWFVFGELRQPLGITVALVLSSLAFMAHHVIVLAGFFPGKFWLLAAPLSAGVAIGGGVWAWLYQTSGALYAPWVSHLLIDMAILAVGYDLVFRESQALSDSSAYHPAAVESSPPSPAGAGP